MFISRSAEWTSKKIVAERAVLALANGLRTTNGGKQREKRKKRAGGGRGRLKRGQILKGVAVRRGRREGLAACDPAQFLLSKRRGLLEKEFPGTGEQKGRRTGVGGHRR